VAAAANGGGSGDYYKLSLFFLRLMLGCTSIAYISMLLECLLELHVLDLTLKCDVCF